MASNRISVLVALEGADDGLKRALNSAQQSLGDLAANAKTAGEKAAAGMAEVKAGMSAFGDQVNSCNTANWNGTAVRTFATATCHGMLLPTRIPGRGPATDGPHIARRVEQALRQCLCGVGPRRIEIGHACAASITDMCGHWPRAVCFIRPSRDDLYRYVHVLVLGVTSRRRPGQPPTTMC